SLNALASHWLSEFWRNMNLDDVCLSNPFYDESEHAALLRSGAVFLEIVSVHLFIGSLGMARRDYRLGRPHGSRRFRWLGDGEVARARRRMVVSCAGISTGGTDGKEGRRNPRIVWTPRVEDEVKLPTTAYAL